MSIVVKVGQLSGSLSWGYVLGHAVSRYGQLQGWGKYWGEPEPPSSDSHHFREFGTQSDDRPDQNKSQI